MYFKSFDNKRQTSLIFVQIQKKGGQKIIHSIILNSIQGDAFLHKKLKIGHPLGEQLIKQALIPQPVFLFPYRPLFYKRHSHHSIFLPII